MTHIQYVNMSGVTFKMSKRTFNKSREQSSHRRIKSIIKIINRTNTNRNRINQHRENKKINKRRNNLN